MKNKGAGYVVSDILFDLEYLMLKCKENLNDFPDDVSFKRSLRRFKACYRIMSLERADQLDYMFKLQQYLDGKTDDLPV